MAQFEYLAPTTAEEAARALSAPGAKALSGGTDLLVQMKSGMREPGTIIDVKKIPEMVSITEKNGAFTIGAATPAAVAKLLKASGAPLLALAARC